MADDCDSWIDGLVRLLPPCCDYPTTHNTHRHTHPRTQALVALSATTQLATVCVLPSSLLQASRSALRQGKPAHTLSCARAHTRTHSSLLHSHIFFWGREEMRREQRQGGVALFASSHSCRAAVKSGRPQISQGFLAAPRGKLFQRGSERRS